MIIAAGPWSFTKSQAPFEIYSSNRPVRQPLPSPHFSDTEAKAWESRGLSEVTQMTNGKAGLWTQSDVTLGQHCHLTGTHKHHTPHGHAWLAQWPQPWDMSTVGPLYP